MTPGIAYLCGPISHRPNGNREAFARAEQHMLDRDWAVINPLTIRPQLSRDALQEAVDLGDRYREGPLYQKVMRGCYSDLLSVALLCALPEWDTSTGAIDEVWFAGRIGLRILEFDPTISFLEPIAPQCVIEVR